MNKENVIHTHTHTHIHNGILFSHKKEENPARKLRVPNKMNANKPVPRHIIIKVAKVKDKERLFKTARENLLHTHTHTHKNPIRLSA